MWSSGLARVASGPAGARDATRSEPKGQAFWGGRSSQYAVYCGAGGTHNMAVFQTTLWRVRASRLRNTLKGPAFKICEAHKERHAPQEWRFVTKKAPCTREKASGNGGNDAFADPAPRNVPCSSGGAWPHIIIGLYRISKSQLISTPPPPRSSLPIPPTTFPRTPPGGT